MIPRVTVVMPVYNGERFVAEAVRSVLASTLRELELLVLDDGSTDDSVAAARRAAGGDARVRILSLPHGGVAAARNAGLGEARGDLIANLDSDDAMFPERLARQVAHLDRHRDCVAVGSRVLVVDESGRPKRIGGRLFTHEEIDRAHLDGRGGALWNPTVTFRRAAGVAVGGYRAQLHTTGEDHDFWLRLGEVGRLENLTDVLVRYRVHGRNVSLDKTDADRRRAVTVETLRRAFERRGITDRQPEKLPAPPLSAAERYRDRALLRYFTGHRATAMWHALVGFVLDPTAPVSRAAIRTVLGGAPPRSSSAME